MKPRPPNLHLDEASRRLRGRYGASPLHLLLVLCSFALALYAGLRLLKGDTVRVAIWFVGAALLHDLVLLPAYSLTDRALQKLQGDPAAEPGRSRRMWINYVRVPGFISLLLLAVWYPLILSRVPAYRAYTGLNPDVYLGHWLLITAVLFGVSALLLVTSVVRRRPPKRARPAQRSRHR